MNMQPELFVKMALDAWYNQVRYTDELIDQLTDQQLQQQVAPGRNTGTYLLGHLTAVHDRMLPLLSLGDQLDPSLFKTFVEQPDQGGASPKSLDELRGLWKKVNEKLALSFQQLDTAGWFQRHNSVTEEDFKKEPHRNKLNVVINRTNHLASHRGQLIFLKPRQ